MRKYFLIPALFMATITMFVSCQKEVSDDDFVTPPSDNALLGTWKFLHLDAVTEVTAEITDDLGKMKSISTSAYQTKNNQGSIVIDETKIMGKQVGYDISTVVDVDVYIEDVFIDSMEEPFDFSVPPADTESEYKRIGSDSLYFPGGLFVDPGAQPGTDMASGAKYRIENNRLILTASFADVIESDEMGVNQRSAYKGSMIVTLEKQ